MKGTKQNTTRLAQQTGHPEPEQMQRAETEKIGTSKCAGQMQKKERKRREKS